MRVRIQTISECLPNESNTDCRHGFMEQAGEERCRTWVCKWTKIRNDCATDGRTMSSKRFNLKYSERHKRELIAHCVGLNNRRPDDGSRRAAHCQTATVRWFNNRYPMRSSTRQQLDSFSWTKASNGESDPSGAFTMCYKLLERVTVGRTCFSLRSNC